MTMSDAELDRLLERQCELEKSVAKLVSRTVENTDNSILKLFLDRLVHDSLKHADMIQALMDLRKGAVVSVVQKEGMQKALEEHVAREKEMLRALNEIIQHAHEPRDKALLQQIAEDEKKHHRILGEVTKILGWKDSAQEDWWNTVDKVEWMF